MQMKPLDPTFTIHQQLEERTTGPVVLVNVFTLDPADEGAFLEAWKKDALFMKARPGFISTQLNRAVGASPTYFNEAVWETLDAFRSAITDPGFRARLAEYPASASTSPHLFHKVAIPGVCCA